MLSFSSNPTMPSTPHRMSTTSSESIWIDAAHLLAGSGGNTTPEMAAVPSTTSIREERSFASTAAVGNAVAIAPDGAVIVPVLMETSSLESATYGKYNVEKS